jgi:hypothetical protein
MRRIRIVGLCLVALLAVACLASTSAFGLSTPTWYQCVKASPKNTGNYKNKTCSEASEAGKGAYALKEGIGKGHEFKGKGGEAVLHVKTWLGDDKVICKDSKTSGKFEVPNLERDVSVSYSKCAALETRVCASAGAKKGEIKISGLRGELGYVEESPVSVGLKLESEAHPGPSGELAKFTCENLEATILGGVIGVVGKDVDVINKESETVDLATERIGEHEYEGFKYKPTVNIVGWAAEQEAIAAEVKEDEEGKIEKINRPILKAVICGPFIEELLNKKCTPEAYSGLDTTTINKGEALMINTNAPAPPA